MISYKRRWIIYTWMANQNLDDLIHKEDLELVNEIGGLGVCYCIDQIDDYMLIMFKQYQIRVSVNNKAITRK